MVSSEIVCILIRQETEPLRAAVDELQQRVNVLERHVRELEGNGRAEGELRASVEGTNESQ